MSRVLVVDDDPWTQRMVSSVLTHDGLAVDLAGDGWEALICAGRQPPDLVIVKVKLPSTDAWTLVATLRTRAELARVPALFLTSFMDDDARGPSFRADSDDTIAKPFRLEDLQVKVTTLLSRVRPAPGAPGAPPRPASAPPRSETMRPTPPGPLPTLHRPFAGGAAGRALPRRTALSGALEQFGLPSVLMLLDLERRSGVAILTATGGLGRIYVREGRVVRATIEGRSDVFGAGAVYDLLGWSQGHFEFHPGEVEGRDEIGSSTSFLLMEGARREDERRQKKAHN
jgi:CheY-like chemotaxis protein